MSTDMVPAGQYTKSYWRNEEHALAKFAGGAGAIGFALVAMASVPITTFFGVPLLFTGFGAVIGHMFVPGSESFKEAVQKRLVKEAEDYEETKLVQYASPEHSKVYQGMKRRMEEVESMIAGRRGVMLGKTWEMFKNTPLNYLRLAYAAVQFQQSQHGTTESELEQDIEELNAMIESSSGVEQRRYQSARKQLLQVLERNRSMSSRAVEVNARLITMKSGFDEVCTHLVKNPVSGLEGEVVRDLVSRFDIEEEMSMFLSDGGESLDSQISDLGVSEEDLFSNDQDTPASSSVSMEEVETFLRNGR